MDGKEIIKVTDANGVAKLTKEEIGAEGATHVVRVLNPVTNETLTFNVSLSKPAPVEPTIILKAAKKTIKIKRSAKKLVLKAGLKIDGKKVKGKIIKLKFNGKTYKVKTNKKGIAKFAINKKVHIHLVAHPRKIERFQTRLSLYDIAGSSNIVNKAYNIISILRVDTIQKDSKDYEKLQKELLNERYNIENVDTVLEVLKTKGERCGLVGLKYLKEIKTFIESDKMSNVEIEKKIYKKDDKEELPW